MLQQVGRIPDQHLQRLGDLLMVERAKLVHLALGLLLGQRFKIALRLEKLAQPVDSVLVGRHRRF